MTALYGPLPSGTSGLKYGCTPKGSGKPRESICGVGVGFCTLTPINSIIASAAVHIVVALIAPPLTLNLLNRCRQCEGDERIAGWSLQKTAAAGRQDHVLPATVQ